MYQLAAVVIAFGLSAVNCHGTERSAPQVTQSDEIGGEVSDTSELTTTESTVTTTQPNDHRGDHHDQRPGEHRDRHREHHGEHWGEGRDYYGVPLTCDETCEMCSSCTPPPSNSQAEPQREPQSEKPATTENENLGISQSRAKVVCSDSPHAHPQFLRSDLAYSVTGVDCAGDLPQPAGETPKIVGRGIASEKLKCGPNDHPMFLRSDLSYSVNHEDCFGDAP